MDARPIDLEFLRSYLADSLPAEEMARAEKALRESSELRAQLEDARQNRGDAGLHTLGAIWRRTRLTCPTRQQLGSFLLEALDPDLGEYIKFHIEVIACAYCEANLADLRQKTEQPPAATQARHHRILQSSRHLLTDESNA
jgi:hypothetical protein